MTDAFLKEGREHEDKALKHLEVSFFALKFSKDALGASMEYSTAAMAYQNGKDADSAIRCYTKAAEFKRETGDIQGVGRSLESAAKLESDRGNDATALQLWTEAARNFRLADKADLAIKVLLKAAQTCAKDPAKQDEAEQRYEELINVHEDSGKNHMVADVFREFQSFLMTAQKYDALVKTMDRHIAVLAAQGSNQFAYREVISKVILFVCVKNDTVGAEDAVNQAVEKVTGWLGSDEFGDAQDFIDAVKQGDQEKFDQIKKKSAFSYVQVDMGRIFKNYKLNTVADGGPDFM